MSCAITRPVPGSTPLMSPVVYCRPPLTPTKRQTPGVDCLRSQLARLMTAMGISPFLKNKDYQIRALGVKKNLCCGAAHYAAASSAASAPSPRARRANPATRAPGAALSRNAPTVTSGLVTRACSSRHRSA